MKRVKGFTLIELMVTLAVAAILIAVAVPNFGQLIADNRISSNASAFNQTLNLARSEAVRRGAPVFVCSSNDQATCGGSWNDGWLVWADLDNDGAFNNNDVIVRVQSALANTTTLVQQGLGLLSFNYNANGFLNVPPGNALSFELCDNGRTGEMGRVMRIPAVGKTTTNEFVCS